MEPCRKADLVDAVLFYGAEAIEQESNKSIKRSRTLTGVLGKILIAGLASGFKSNLNAQLCNPFPVPTDQKYLSDSV